VRDLSDYLLPIPNTEGYDFIKNLTKYSNRLAYPGSCELRSHGYKHQSLVPKEEGATNQQYLLPLPPNLTITREQWIEGLILYGKRVENITNIEKEKRLCLDGVKTDKRQMIETLIEELSDRDESDHTFIIRCLQYNVISTFLD